MIALDTQLTVFGPNYEKVTILRRRDSCHNGPVRPRLAPLAGEPGEAGDRVIARRPGGPDSRACKGSKFSSTSAVILVYFPDFFLGPFLLEDMVRRGILGQQCVGSFGLLHSLPVKPRDAVADLQVLADRDTMPTHAIDAPHAAPAASRHTTSGVALCVAPVLLTP